jgi:hypothetical protein
MNNQCKIVFAQCILRSNLTNTLQNTFKKWLKNGEPNKGCSQKEIITISELKVIHKNKGNF